MPLKSSFHWLPKDFESPEGYEDAFASDEAREFAAVADGVSSAIYSRDWAFLLTERVVKEPPVPGSEAYLGWLNALRREWEEGVRKIPKNFFQKAKLEQCGGAYSTLLWIAPASPEASGDPDVRRFRCHAVGDCCLFQLRAGELIKTFPVTCAEDFDLYPASLCSRVQAEEPPFQSCELEVRVGDKLFLSTDAWAQWVFTEIEAGQVVDWESWEQADADEFRRRIRHLRDENVIRVDDTTLLMLQLTSDLVPAATDAAAPAVEQADQTPVEAAPAAETVSPEEAATSPAARTETPVPKEDRPVLVLPADAPLESTAIEHVLAPADGPAESSQNS